ncbi:amino acid adenylation domain-containing protein [Streptomyces sp. V2I9]|uniref:amino acid adenylation domain-containing protein n=1 Tax=Streptomyces sp. V2I9 TaxID=3042304 RepID=UPI002789DA46|nr:amino acid adenylation domain-containing protein [Streptomyces sp. V2I9]MDQ0987945.1 amino acid adenylation domain-containing protein [Streptomyces sp. V2I9]
MTLDEPDRLAALFLKSARRTPERVAVRDAHGSWDYAATAAAVTELAGRLAAAGVEPGDRVGVMGARRAGAPVAILAVLWCGATYVPIDPAWPAARCAAVLHGAGARMVLAVDTARETPANVPRLDLTTPELMSAGSTGPSEPVPAGSAGPSEPLSRPQPGAAYVIFTSGSTGTPKGVEVRSAAAAGLVESVVSLIGMGRESSFVALSSFAFDVSVFEIFAPWSVGGELVIATELQVLSNQLGALLVVPGREVYVQTTPTVLEHLVQARLELPAGTVLLLAGEHLRRALVARVAHVRQVWNLYGPTEATIYTTAHACLPLDADETEPDLPIGSAVARAVLEIRPLSESGQDIGELLVSGPGLALGYVGRPDLTAERFGADGKRYATGDVVRRRADGPLVHAGRIDRQVKIRGNRVELDEVEDALVALLGHRRVAVRMDTHRLIGPHLAAFVAGPERDVAELRRQVAGRLPAYMVPARVYWVPEIPRTSSGKTDHSALRAPESTWNWDDAVFETLSTLWERHLGAPAAPDANFYALDGNRRAAEQIAAGLRRTHGTEVDAAVIERYPLLCDLAAVVSDPLARIDAER